MEKHLTKEVSNPPTGCNTNRGAACGGENDTPRKGNPQMPDTGKPEVEKPEIREVPETAQPEVEKQISKKYPIQPLKKYRIWIHLKYPNRKRPIKIAVYPAYQKPGFKFCVLSL
ncbi:MAG: hypothetical protein IPF72_05310 [Chitinophagaceae bacterium]|nr:hypothetical protein [Chitinophagaceae bacterium]